MSPELIIALLASPVLAGLPTLWFKHRAQRQERDAESQSTVLTRLEQENKRLNASNDDLRSRITMLEQNEDALRDTINELKDACARCQRRLAELGLEGAT